MKKATDGFGMKIDAEIFDMVCTLNLLGFVTSQSCEGHKRRGACYPWIVCTSAPSLLLAEKLDGGKKLTAMEMMNLCIIEFNRRQKKGESVQKLVIVPEGVFGSFKIVPYIEYIVASAKESARTLTEEERDIFVRFGRKKMFEFQKHLEKMYL
jgi:hypothetical protein